MRNSLITNKFCVMRCKIQFCLLILILSFLLFSCDKNDNISQPQACDIQIDPSIKIDTSWKQSYGEFTAVKFFDKYFIVSKLDSNMTIYSNNDGKMMAKLEPPLISRGSIYDCQIENDFYYGFYNDKILRYNILTNEYQYYAFSGNENFIKIIDDEFYFPQDSFFLKGNFKNSVIDTIFNFKKIIPHSEFMPNFAMYKNKNFPGYDELGFVLHGYDYTVDYTVDHLLVYDLKSKRVTYKISGLITSYTIQVDVIDEMLIFNGGKFKYIYNIEDGNFFVMNTPFSFSRDVLSIPSKKINNEYIQAKVFFNNPTLTCYNFYSANSIWNCKYTQAYNLSSINLKDSKNDELTYIAYLSTNDYNYYLQDPNSGFKVAKIDVTGEYSPKFSYQYYVSDIIDNKYIIMTLGGNFYRFDIRKI